MTIFHLEYCKQLFLKIAILDHIHTQTCCFIQVLIIHYFNCHPVLIHARLTFNLLMVIIYLS